MKLCCGTPAHHPDESFFLLAGYYAPAPIWAARARARNGFAQRFAAIYMVESISGTAESINVPRSRFPMTAGVDFFVAWRGWSQLLPRFKYIIIIKKAEIGGNRLHDTSAKKARARSLWG